MAKKPETLFKEKVCRELKTLNNCWFVKTNEVAMRGIPDVFICLNGHFVVLELKKDKRAFRNPLQEWTLNAVANAGGMAFITYPENWGNTLEVLTELAGKRPDITKPISEH